MSREAHRTYGRDDRGGLPDNSYSSRSSADFSSPSRRSGAGADRYSSSSVVRSSVEPVDFSLYIIDMQLSHDFQRSAPRSMAVRVEVPAGLNDGGSALKTRTSLYSGSGPLRLDWNHTFKLSRADPAWDDLRRAIDGAAGASEIAFVVVNAATNSTLGEAYLSLQSVLESGSEHPPSAALAVLDSSSREVGRLRVRTAGAIDALRAVREGGADGGHSTSGRSARSQRALASPRDRDHGQQQQQRYSSPPDVEIELGVQQVRLGSSLSRYPAMPRSVAVRVEARCIFDGADEPTLQTRSERPSGSGPIRFDWSHSLPLRRGERGWERLGLALSGAAEASDLVYVLVDPERERTLGQASFSLGKLLEGGKEQPAQTLKVQDGTGMHVADLMVTIKALDALIEVDASENPPSGAHSGARSGSAGRGGGRAAGRGGEEFAEVEVNVGELRLTLPRGQPPPRRVAVRVEALGLEDSPLETRALAVGANNAPIRFDWSEMLPLRRGDRAWIALDAAVSRSSTKGLDFFFVLIDSVTGSALGEATLSLMAQLDKPPPSRQPQLQLKDSDNRAIGQLTVQVRAHEALKLVQSVGRRAESTDVRATTPRRVDELSTEELIAVLAARGQRVPARAQPKSYYLDMCARLKLRQITHSELVAAMDPNGDADGPAGERQQQGRGGRGVERRGESKSPGRRGARSEAALTISVEEASLTDRAMRFSQPRVCVSTAAPLHSCPTGGVASSGRPARSPSHGSPPRRGCAPPPSSYSRSSTLFLSLPS